MEKRKMPEILPTRGVPWVLSNIIDYYNRDEIEGIVVGIKLKSGEFICAHSSTTKNFSYLEKLGLCSQLEDDIKESVRSENKR